MSRRRLGAAAGPGGLRPVRFDDLDIFGRILAETDRRAALGCKRCDALALVSSNSAEFIAVYYACAKLGIICVPINLFWKHRELGYVLGHARVKLAVVESVLIEQLQTGLDDAADLADVVVIGDPPPGGVSGRRIHAFEPLVATAPTREPEAYAEDRDPISYLYTSGATSARNKAAPASGTSAMPTNGS